MFKNLGHFFAVAAHAVVTVVHKAPAVIAQAGEIAAQAQAVEQQAEPVVNAVVGAVAPGAAPVLQAMEHIFGDACAAFIAAGAASKSGFSLTITTEAAQKIESALGAMAGR